MRLIPWSALAMLILLSACSQPGRGPSTAVGPGISIDEAVASHSAEPLLVNGLLLISAGGEVRLCSALGESNPPTCSGSSLVVDGLEPAKTADLADANGVRWSKKSIQLLGSVANGHLVVSSTSL